MTFRLQAVSRADLRILADGGLPASVATRTADGALPPAFVAQRSLAQLREGKDEYWCSTFYIIRQADDIVVGGCGFKDAPLRGRVEIGYGVSSTCRNQGAATHAVRELLHRAFATAAVSEVLAQVSPGNPSSIRVVEKLGFVGAEATVDEEGEPVVRWIARRPANPSSKGTAEGVAPSER